MESALRLHHMGFVVADIATAMPAFMRSMAAEWDGQIFEDPLQKVKVAFMTTRPGDAQIELVQPVGEDSPVLRFLQQGGGHASPLLRGRRPGGGAGGISLAGRGDCQPSQAGGGFRRTAHRVGDNLGEVSGRVAGSEAAG